MKFVSEIFFFGFVDHSLLFVYFGAIKLINITIKFGSAGSVSDQSNVSPVSHLTVEVCVSR